MSTIIKTFFITFFLLLNFSCQDRKSKKENKIVLLNENKVENFNVFIKNFYSDSIFQINRIIFPLENDIKIEKEYEEALKDSNNINIDDEDNYISHSINNWAFLSDSYFLDNDSIAIIDGKHYRRIFCKTNNSIEENIISIDDDFVVIKMKYRLVNNEWYLVDFIDGFAN